MKTSIRSPRLSLSDLLGRQYTKAVCEARAFASSVDVKQLESIAAPDSLCGRRPLAHTIEREDRRFLEGRREEGARRVRLVVFGEDETLLVFAIKPYLTDEHYRMYTETGMRFWEISGATGFRGNPDHRW